MACLKDPNGNYRTLNEGESTQAHFKITKANLMKGDHLQAKKFWVSDSVGRKYYLPTKAHKKLKQDTKELKEKVVANTK